MIESRKRGATSILVIIMMVVLLVLGLAILTTSLSGVRLAQKKQDWLQSYYKLEIDGAFAQAELNKYLAPLLSKASTTPLTEVELNALSEKITLGSLSVSATDKNRWSISLQVSDTTTKPVKHLTMLFDLDLRTQSDSPLTLTRYRQWQDAFEFKSLPGFEDPLTEDPEFNLEEAGD